jgi:hypothetical protein
MRLCSDAWQAVAAAAPRTMYSVTELKFLRLLKACEKALLIPGAIEGGGAAVAARSGAEDPFLLARYEQVEQQRGLAGRLPRPADPDRLTCSLPPPWRSTCAHSSVTRPNCSVEPAMVVWTPTMRSECDTTMHRPVPPTPAFPPA